jgi:hypothetical protein
MSKNHGTESVFKFICNEGQKADHLYEEGRYREAQKAYLALVGKIEETDHVDSYLVSKITLGLMLTHIKSGDLQRAFSIWNSHIDSSLFGIGIYGLENAQTNIEDMICYDFLCAYLHSISDAPKYECASAINTYMSRVCEYGFEQKDSEMLKGAINNWKLHLNEVFKGTIPHAYALPLIEAEKRFGHAVTLSGLFLPRPATWSRPENFREVSRVIKFKPLKFKPAPKKHRAS